MSNIIPVDFSFEGKAVRVELDEQGEPLFNAEDVCNCLGYKNRWDALKKHVSKKGLAKREVLTTGGKQSVNFLNEGGVYDLLSGSEQKEARTFKDWLHYEVLPSIRKTGSYSIQEDTQITITKTDSETVKSVYDIYTSLGFEQSIARIHAVNSLKKVGREKQAQVLIGPIQEVNIATTQERLMNPTQIGEQLTIPMKAREVNKLLESFGLQFKVKKQWYLTDTGKQYGSYVDQTKKHMNSEIRSVRWNSKVINLLNSKGYI